MGSAIRRGNRVAVGLEEAVGLAEARACPGHRPLDLAGISLALEATREGFGGDGLDVADALGQEVREAVRKAQDRLGGGLVVDQGRVAGPADLDAAEEVGLGAGHPVEAGRPEGGGIAKDDRVRAEGDDRPVLAGRPEFLQPADRLAAAEGLAPLEAVLEGCDLQVLGQGVHHRDAHAMQAA